MNNKGAFSIIAALLVAVVLIGSVMTTYSAIRYGPVQGQPQILSSVDESDLALKQILGFTVGYYGSVLKVTGNMTYAQQLAKNYFDSGLTNAGSIKPEWGLSLSSADLELKANWFTNDSYSQGNMNVTYDLNGLGITGVTYSDSTRLEVQVSDINSTTQAQFKVLTDNGEPQINLAAKNLKFYHYVYGNLTWDFSVPTNIISRGDGTYIVDLPAGVSGNSYVVQVEDTRGLSVLASAFSEFTTSIAWNTTGFKLTPDYVDSANLDVLGTHSNFAAQQTATDGVYDTLAEGASGTTYWPTYPTSYNLLGSTTLTGGTLNDLQSNEGNRMKLGSYVSSYAGQTIYAHQESAPLASSYYLKLVSSDQSGTSLSASARNTGRQLIGKFVYPLSGISSIPASSGTIYYRARGDSGVAGYCDADIVVRRSNGNIRATLAQTTANSGPDNLTTSYSTLSGPYSIAAYTVVDQTDYLEFDYYIYVTTSSSGAQVNLRIDDNTLAQASQTRVTNINLPSNYVVQTEFTGSSPSTLLSNLIWTIDSSASTVGVNATFQFYKWATGQYPVSGEGFMNTLLNNTDQFMPQAITNPSSFVNSSGYWKVMVTAFIPTYFGLNLDFIQYNPEVPNYALNLEEQWTNVNATNLRQDLCIKTGSFNGTEPLLVQILQGSNWQNLTTLIPNYFNNVSLAPYINSPTLTIRFVGTNETTDPTRDSWNIDTVYIKDEPDINFLVNQQQSTFTMELLQNGTMRWLGQNMQLTSQTLPIPPIPVRAIHVNQTINGVNQEVPFQVEDWASSYQIPLGLTSNTTLFGNRQMIVFLLNSKVTDFTVWWNGSDAATQTPLAFTNRYFTNDNPNANPPTITNGYVILSIGGFNVRATVGTTSSTANFMRINQQASVYGAGAAFVIHHGIVRDVVQQEAEWNNGPTGSPNLYSNIVLTLPANATYYTYQLRIMFIDSAQARSITDLSPIQLTTSLSTPQLQTENGTLAGSPIIQNGTGTFVNSTIGSWTPHHFSQFILDGKGAGIMFNDVANQKLYAFDSFAGSNSKGGFKVAAASLEMDPVSSGQVPFTFAYDITWQGAVATFDGTTPLCNLYDGTTPMGLWILAEYPPMLTATPKS